MKSVKLLFFCWLTLSIFWVGCTDNSTLFEENKSIADANWDGGFMQAAIAK
jgi:hypothetical protein